MNHDQLKSIRITILTLGFLKEYMLYHQFRIEPNMVDLFIEEIRCMIKNLGIFYEINSAKKISKDNI